MRPKVGQVIRCQDSMGREHDGIVIEVRKDEFVVETPTEVLEFVMMPHGQCHICGQPAEGDLIELGYDRKPRSLCARCRKAQGLDPP
jgi:hypothetical protein